MEGVETPLNISEISRSLKYLGVLSSPHLHKRVDNFEENKFKKNLCENMFDFPSKNSRTTEVPQTQFSIRNSSKSVGLRRFLLTDAMPTANQQPFRRLKILLGSVI